MNKTMLWKVGAMAVAFVIAGCGGGETATPTPQPSPTTVRLAPTATPTQVVARPTPTPAPVTTAPTATPAPTPTPARTQAPPAARQGSRVVVALDTFGSDSFIVYKQPGAGVQAIYNAIYDYLLYFDPQDRSYGPGLATSWRIEPNGLKWTIRLREGVNFSDGTELTATDVKFLLDKMAAPGATHPYPGSWAAVVSVEQTGKYEVVVTFKNQFLDFAEQISDFFWFPILSKAHMDKVGEAGYQEHPIGSGPYTLTARVPGFSYRYKAIEQHWRLGVPGFRELEIRMIPEATTRLAALRTGQADVTPLPSAMAGTVEKLSDFRLVSLPGAYGTGMYWGGLYPPDNPKYDPSNVLVKLGVRKALNLALNRQEIVETILDGHARSASLFPYLMPGWDQLKPYPYDPTQAKSLLVQAGHAGGLEIVAWSFATKPENPDILEAICGYWAAVGVSCKLRPTEFGAFVPKLFSFDVTGQVWLFSTGFRPEPISGLRTSMGHKPRVAGFWDKEIADLVDKAGEQGDPGERAKTYRQIGQLQYERYSHAPLVNADALVAMGKRIAGDWQPIPRYAVDGWETLRPALGQ